MMLKFLLAAVTIASVAAETCSKDSDCTDGSGDDATKTLCRVSGGGLCVACLGTSATGCSGTKVCSVARTDVNTCVAAGTDDASCAAIDPASPLFCCVLKKCVNFSELQGKSYPNRGDPGEPLCARNDATCIEFSKKYWFRSAKPIWATVAKKCVVAPSNSLTCAAIDAAKSKWLSPITCAGAGIAAFMQQEPCGPLNEEPPFVVFDKTWSMDPSTQSKVFSGPFLAPFIASYGGSCVACLVTADCTTTDVCSTATPNTCVAVGSSDATCVAINAATPKFVGSACVAASPPVTCGDGTALTANKCEIISPTEVELAKMCGDGTTYDKAKKKCVTDPTSRCTTNAESAKESAGSRTATLTLITATMLVLVVIPLY